MRFLSTADAHCGEYPSGPTVNGVNQRIVDLVRQFERIRSYALHNGIKHLFVLGDMFRTKQPSMLILSVVSEIFYGFRECGVTVWVITGNHDVYRMEGQANALSVYKHMHMQGTHIFDQPTITSIEGIKFLMFPYTGAPQDLRLRQAIQSYPGADILLMHGSVEGAVVNRHVDYEIHDDDEIKYETVSPFKLVLAGHLHQSHSVGNVWYPGSIEHLTFDDEGVDKFFLDVNFTNGAATVQQVPLDTRKMMTLHYDQMPQVITGQIDIKDAIVRVVGVEPEYYQEVHKMIRDRGCYHLVSVEREQKERQDIEPIEDIKMDDTTFARQFLKKVSYKGDADRAVQAIMEALSG